MRYFVMGACLLVNLFLVSVLQADTSRVLVEYRYGNQITRSTLKIHSDGLVEGKEFLQARVKKSIEERLSESELAHLKIAIENANSGELHRKRGNPTTLGSKSGSLIVYPVSEKSVPVRTIERAVPGRLGLINDTVIINLSPDARWIEALVLSFVEIKMPLDQ